MSDRKGSGRIIAPFVKRVAAADPPDSLDGSHDRTMFLDCLNKVVAARRIKSADGTVQRADRLLVNPHRENQQPRRNSNQISTRLFDQFRHPDLRTYLGPPQNNFRRKR